MNSLDRRDKENEVEKLTRILSTVKNLYFRKKDQLEELQQEIEQLKSVLNYLNSFISDKSFHSAEDLYSGFIKQKSEQQLEEDYFKEKVEKEQVKGTVIKRKIFSKGNDECDEGELLCILKLIDFNRVEIKLIDPEKRSVKESSDNFIESFLKGALVEIKKKNPDLNVEYKFYKNSDLIEIIQIINLHSINEYDIITSGISDLLAGKYAPELK